MNFSDVLESRGLTAIKNVLNIVGGWPMIERNWTGNSWDLKKSILNLRKFITGNDEDIFGSRKVAETKQESKNILESEKLSLKNELKNLITDVAIQMGAQNSQQLKIDVDNLILFEEHLANVSLTYRFSRNS